MSHTAHALVYSAPGKARIEEVALGSPGAGEVLVQTAFSGLSRGTERLVFHGHVPDREWRRMRAPLQVGDFPFPVRYGYAAVGEVMKGPDHLTGRTVFCLAPHQTSFVAPEGMVLELPESLPPERAVLAANMETALNAIWDAGLRPGQRILIVGAGLVGLLVTSLLSLKRGISVTVTDVRKESGIKADDFGVSFVTPDKVSDEAFDVVFHTSASDAGLATALNALAFEGRLIELSWYGDRPVTVPMGAAFHANRLQIISSQVGHVASPRRATTTHRDRLALALDALADPRLDGLFTDEIPFRDLPTALPRLLGPRPTGIATRITYTQGALPCTPSKSAIT